jgi:enoyl-CoA hydratase
VASDSENGGDYEFLRWELDGSIATVWLARPPVNAVSQAMYREIRTLFADVPQLGQDIRVIILAGEGRHFCAGNDLEEFKTLNPANSHARMREVREAFFAIQDAPVPVIAAVQGSALGTGLAIAASCDFVVAAEGARLGATEIKVGVMGAAKHLARLVPQPVVRSMFFSGEPLPVEELVRYGAVIAVVPRERLHAEAHRRAAEVARHSPAAIRFAKQSLNRIEFMELQPGYEYEQTLTGELSGYRDAKEALDAFFEQRDPQFTGQ